MGRALDDGVDVQRLREATLFSFSSAADMLLFERLLSHGLNIRPCVCVNGREWTWSMSMIMHTAFSSRTTWCT